MSREECSDRLIEQLADLLETELSMVAEFDDLTICFIELADCVLQGVIRLRWLVRAGFILGSGVLQVSWVGWFGMALSSSELIADTVHGDPEQPRLESALLVVAVLAEFGRYGDKHGLGDLLGEVVVVEPGSRHCEHSAGIGVHESAPRILMALRGLVDEETDRLFLLILWLGLDTQCGHHPCRHNGDHERVLPDLYCTNTEIGMLHAPS